MVENKNLVLLFGKCQHSIIRNVDLDFFRFYRNCFLVYKGTNEPEKNAVFSFGLYLQVIYLSNTYTYTCYCQ